jgi:hypothetical protein
MPDFVGMGHKRSGSLSLAYSLSAHQMTRKAERE